MFFQHLVDAYSESLVVEAFCDEVFVDPELRSRHRFALRNLGEIETKFSVMATHGQKLLIVFNCGRTMLQSLSNISTSRKGYCDIYGYCSCALWKVTREHGAHVYTDVWPLKSLRLRHRPADSFMWPFFSFLFSFPLSFPPLLWSGVCEAESNSHGLRPIKSCLHSISMNNVTFWYWTRGIFCCMETWFSNEIKKMMYCIFRETHFYNTLKEL